MTAFPAPAAPDELDRLANKLFAGRVVRKDLVRQVKVGVNVPVHVLEFLLGTYCASDDPAAIEAGMAVVTQILTENFIRPDESEQAKAAVKRKGKHRLIDKVDVRLVESEGKFWAHLASFGSNHVHLAESTVYAYPRLLGGGVWCQLELVYDEGDDEVGKRPFHIASLKPIQIATFDLDAFAAGRAELTRDQWLDLVLRSLGFEPRALDLRSKLLLVLRIVPMAERNFNLIELGPRGTGKSFLYRESNPNSMLISGGRVTVPQLFVRLSGRPQVGLLGHWDVVAFDEVAALELSGSTVIQMLKDYMESGSFARGKEEMPAEASIVLIGNTSKATEDLVRSSHLFADLPRAMVDTAFLDRLHAYLPGWEVPKLDRSLFTDHYGFVSDYFAEALRELRKTSHVRALDGEFALGDHLSARDERAVRKTVSGFLKILHPHGHWARSDLRDYLELAIEGRRRVKEQLKKLAAYEFSRTDFSYVERDTGREVFVDVRELQEADGVDLDTIARAGAAALPGPAGLASATGTSPLEVLMAGGESSRFELKETFRFNRYTSQRDEALELGVVKSIAGFANAAGGTLVIGVTDDRRPLGLDRDIALCGNKGVDGFENTLSTMVERSLGALALTLTAVTFPVLDGLTLCRVDVRVAREPVFAAGKAGQQLFVRTGNSTRSLSIADAVDYIRHRF